MGISDDRESRWPRFVLVTFPKPTSILPELAAPLVEHGVPKSLFKAYQAAQELTLLQVPGHEPLVCFGSLANYLRLCLDSQTGHVVAVAPDGEVSPINSSLDQFRASVRAMLARFPYDTGRTGAETNQDSVEDRLQGEWDRAAYELRETLGHIDPATMQVNNGFWTILLEDMRMGDFSMKDILGRDRRDPSNATPWGIHGKRSAKVNNVRRTGAAPE